MFLMFYFVYNIHNWFKKLKQFRNLLIKEIFFLSFNFIIISKNKIIFLYRCNLFHRSYYLDFLVFTSHTFYKK